MLEGSFSTACYSHDNYLPDVAVNVTFLEGFFQDLVCTTTSSYRGKSVTNLMWCRAGHIASSQQVKVVLKVKE